MTQALNRISSRLTALFYMMFRSAKEEADQRTLTRHIVEINKKESSADIINEVALCFKEILNYRLFAFVVKKESSVDVWLDPRMYRKSLEDVILKDFHIADKNEITYLNQEFKPDETQERFELNRLVYYELNEDNCYCRIYMLPARDMNGYDDEAVSLILQGCSSALSRQLKIEHLRNAAVIDPLTRCYNRREFENQLRRSAAGAARHGKPLSVFMFDLDYFKRINDTYGHLAGDQVLVEVSELVRKNMRTGDMLARYGGEEFIALLPETDLNKAMELADRLCKKIAAYPVIHEEKHIPVTASFGVAELDWRADLTKIIQDADTMLYKAKLNGRNRVMPGVIKVVPDDAVHPGQSVRQELRV